MNRCAPPPLPASTRHSSRWTSAQNLQPHPAGLQRVKDCTKLTSNASTMFHPTRCNVLCHTALFEACCPPTPTHPSTRTCQHQPQLPIDVSAVEHVPGATPAPALRIQVQQLAAAACRTAEHTEQKHYLVSHGAPCATCNPSSSPGPAAGCCCLQDRRHMNSRDAS
jgi:hypothetical protein